MVRLYIYIHVCVTRTIVHATAESHSRFYRFAARVAKFPFRFLFVPRVSAARRNLSFVHPGERSYLRIYVVGGGRAYRTTGEVIPYGIVNRCAWDSRMPTRNPKRGRESRGPGECSTRPSVCLLPASPPPLVRRDNVYTSSGRPDDAALIGHGRSTPELSAHVSDAENGEKTTGTQVPPPSGSQRFATRVRSIRGPRSLRAQHRSRPRAGTDWLGRRAGRLDETGQVQCCRADLRTL